MPDTTLEKHLADLQTTALVAETMLSALVGVIGNPDRDQIAYNLADGAHDLVKELTAGLDSVNLPKEAAA